MVCLRLLGLDLAGGSVRANVGGGGVGTRPWWLALLANVGGGDSRRCVDLPTALGTELVSRTFVSLHQTPANPPTPPLCTLQGMAWMGMGLQVNPHCKTP